MTLKYGYQLQTGDIIVCEGYRWVVDYVNFDPRGNTGKQPRYVVHCHGVTPHQPFARHMDIGQLVNLRFQVV